MEECKDRLCKKLSGAQLETELYELDTVDGEDPDTCMGRVEEIVGQADQDTITDDTRNMLQATTFLRLIHVNQRMYFYIKEKSTALNDPYALLRHAREYLRTRGHEDAQTKLLVEKQLKKAGIEPKTEESAQTTSTTESTSKTTSAEAKDTKTVPTVVADMKAKIEEISKQLNTEATVDARFLSTKAKTPDWYEKLSSGHNEHERTLRGVKSDIQDMKSSLKTISKAIEKQKSYKSATYKSKNANDKKDEKSKFFKKGNGGNDKNGSKGKGRGKSNYRSPVVVNYYGAAGGEDSDEDTSESSHSEPEAEDTKE